MTNVNFSIESVRAEFPGLAQQTILMDNAGGSQTLRSVMDRIVQYLTVANVQHGASYATSRRAVDMVDSSLKLLKDWFNAQNIEEIIVGPSTTALLRVLSLCLHQQWRAGDEVIISAADHAANMDCWRDLQKQGIVIKTWPINRETLQLECDDLRALLTDRTRLLAVTHVSNVLGGINPIQQYAEIVHQAGALICVDGVAYAPHRAIDVQAWDVDFYVFSTYKTYGPHQGVMYGRLELLQAMSGINHQFIKSVPYKFQPGNLNYEMAYSLGAIVEYLCALGQSNADSIQSQLSDSFAQIAAYEESLSQRLLSYLNQNPSIRIIGDTQADKDCRVPTVSFVHDRLSSDAIVQRIDQHNIGIRYGDFYAVDLIDSLGLRQNKGVVRVSLAHYNTLQEVDQLLQLFERYL